MRFTSLACDYDGTLADAGKVLPSTLDALEKVRTAGRKLILVTGRELDDLFHVFPEYAVFDKIVAENGALLYSPSTREEKSLAEPPSPEFIAALRKRGVNPLSIGRTIVATCVPHDVDAQEVIRDLGFELQVIYNKGSVMVLPSGVNKSTGLLAALSDLGLSAHNVVAVGDGENDHALLNLCECQVAVANAVPSLQERADLTTSECAGKGVEELIERMLLDDLNDVRLRHERACIPLGNTPEGKEFSINSHDASVIIAGPSASGKSTVVRSVLDRLVARGYQVCLIDPEGDYDEVEELITLGTHNRAPVLEEVLQVLQKPDKSLGINLLGIPLNDRPSFFASLLPQIYSLQASTGRPHWLVVDEAHHMLPSESEQASPIAWQKVPGLILVTVDVESVLPKVLTTVTGVIAVGPSPEQTLQRFGNAIGVAPPLNGALTHERGKVAVWLTTDQKEIIPVHIRPSTLETRRHKQKYAVGSLSDDEAFYFRGPKGALKLRAQNLMLFMQMADGVDDETWLYHLRNGEYSAWFRSAIKDEELAAETTEIERNWEAPAGESRNKIMDAIKKRYTAPE